MCREHYSVTEAVIEKLTPLRWTDDPGCLEIDRAALQDSGARYAKAWLMLAALFLCVALLLGDLLFATSVTAKLATYVTAAAAAFSLTMATVIAAQKHARR